MSFDHLYVAGLAAKTVFCDQNAKLFSYEKIRTPSSLVFRFEYKISGTSKVLFVKLPGSESAQPERVIKRLRREFDLTKRVKSVFKSEPEMEVVSPAGFIDEINGLLTWEVCGDSLQDEISAKLRFRFGRRISELDRLSELSGKWLHRYHSLDLLEGNFNLHQEILSFCGGRLEALARHKNSQVTKTMAESLKSTISVWIDEALSSPETRVILCHNDFSPHNIIVTDKGICVLDFSFSTPGLPAFDLACFWHKLEDMKGSPHLGRRGLESIQSRFLDSYGTDFNMTRPDIKLGLTRLVLSKMLTLLDARKNRLYSLIENRRRYSSYLALLESGFE